MQKTRALTLVLTLTLLALFSTANAEIRTFEASIDGAQAANCAGTGSPATGTGTFTLDTVTGQVDYSITFDEGSLLGPETVSHVHGPAAACTGAGVVFGLPLGNPKVGSATLTPAQVTEMIDGLYYVNIHSSVHTGGEIRGQILESQAIPTLSEWAMILSAILLLAIGSTWAVRRRATA